MDDVHSQEMVHIVKLFTDLQHGDCWVGNQFRETLQGLTAAQAAALVTGAPNTLWQLVVHVMYWRSTVINRLNGNSNPPPFKDMFLPDDLSEASWRRTLLDFETIYHQLRSALLHFKASQLHQPSVVPDQTHYQLIMGCLQHDAYHLGQMKMLKDMLQLS